YKLGFCPNGPDCRYRHMKLPGPPPPVEALAEKFQLQLQQRPPFHFAGGMGGGGGGMGGGMGGSILLGAVHFLFVRAWTNTAHHRLTAPSTLLTRGNDEGTDDDCVGGSSRGEGARREEEGEGGGEGGRGEGGREGEEGTEDD
ncbi:unnamed protein product, partial [Closterium sp. NIES-53]